MIWYVHRQAGAIVFAGQYVQPGYATESLDDTVSAELQAFLAPSPSQVFQQALAAGVAVTSTGTPSLNAIYTIDQKQDATITGIATGIAARGRVPGGGATFDYPDKAYLDSDGASGSTHAFTGAQFLNLAAAIEDYVYALSRGQTPTTPLVIA